MDNNVYYDDKIDFQKIAMGEKPAKVTPKPEMNVITAKREPLMWEMDPKGYFLIEPKPEEELIYAHHYDADRKYNCSLVGENAEELYHTIIKREMITSLQHAAYLGKELEKAEIAITYDVKEYEQDEPLYFNTEEVQEEE